MNEELKNILDEGETVLHQSVPESFETLDRTNKGHFTIKTVLAVGICGAMIIAYIIGTAATASFKPVLVIVLAFIAVMVCLSTFLDARKIRRQRFFITDRRLIWYNDSMRSIPYPSITQYKIARDEDGHTSLLIGENAVKSKSRKWRFMATSPVFMNQETGICEQAVFYAISDPEKFMTVFEDQIKRTRGSR